MLTNIEKKCEHVVACAFLKVTAIYVGGIEAFGKVSKKLSEVSYWGTARHELAEGPFPNLVQVIPKLASAGYKISEKSFKVFEASKSYAKKIAESSVVKQMTCMANA